MDHHIAEKPARPFDIIDRRRGRITRRDLHHFNIANRARVNFGPKAGKTGVKTAVETNHQNRTGFLDHLKAIAHPPGIQIDRLFTENRLARPRGQFDLIGMKIGRGGNDNGVNIGIRHDFLDRRTGRPGKGNRIFRRGIDRVENLGDFGIWQGLNGFGVGDADTASTKKSDIKHV